MKSFSKVILALAVVLGTVSFANAQIRVGAGVNAGLAMGDWADLDYSLGIGGGVSGEYMLTDNIGLGLSLGFMSFAGETITQEIPFFGTVEVEQPSISLIPIQVQGNYHFMPGEDFNFYAGLGLGLALLTPEEGDGESGFVITPRIGANYMFTDALGLDLNVGYSILNITPEGADESFDYSYLPINLGLIYVID